MGYQLGMIDILCAIKEIKNMCNIKFKENDIIERKGIMWEGVTQARILRVDENNKRYIMSEKGEIFNFPFDFLEERWQLKK